MNTSSTAKARRHWTAAEKAKLVRRHLRDGVPVSTLADESGAAPSQIHSWIKMVLECAEEALVDRRQQRSEKRHAQELESRAQRIRQLEEVTAELSMEVLQLKKANGVT